MRFSRLFSTLIASFSLYILTPTVASAQGTTPDPTDAITNFFHSCSDTGCQWVAPDGAAGSYIECVCPIPPSVKLPTNPIASELQHATPGLGVRTSISLKIPLTNYKNLSVI